MELVRGDLDDDQHHQQRKKDRRTDKVTPAQRHGDGIAAGFPQRRRGDLDDPEYERDLGNLARIVLTAFHVGSWNLPRVPAPCLRFDVRDRCYTEYSMLTLIGFSCGFSGRRAIELTPARSDRLQASLPAGLLTGALAGPPYLTDDPNPTVYQRFDRS